MNRSFLLAPLSAIAIFCFAWQTLSQTVEPEKIVRPRTVAAAAAQQTTTKVPQPPQTTQEAPAVKPEPVPSAGAGAPTETSSALFSVFNPTMIQSKIVEAKRLFKTRPLPTAMTSPSTLFVNIAAIDQKTSQIHIATVAKELFLKKGSEISASSSFGEPLTIRVVRANGVNTALTIFTQDGRSLAPLVIEFPIEKGGSFKELAYYTSAHPALLSKDLSRSGQSYVRNMLDLAAKRLRDKGVFISDELVDIAERLCVVEHVDHDRFRNENRLALYDEIYSLYALNEIDTYRYSVSWAGAGGMVQMIPWAYNLVRQRHPGVGLNPDFVIGMRNHSNALQAMLLYMRDTWNDLAANDEVKYAMGAKLATMPELMAAGYNSNAAKLPGYLKRGGEDWKVLIPRETQMYLQIYKSFDALVPVKNRATTPAQTTAETN
jgi:hypothetical protein